MTKKIYALGDSHSGTLHPWCDAINFGAETIHTLTTGKIDGHFRLFLEDKSLSKDGLWIFCFGEIDIRCHVHKQIHHKGRNEDEVLTKLVNDYLTKINTLHHDIAVMSIVPPCYYEDRKHEVDSDPASLIYQIVGSDADRSRWTQKLNDFMESECVRLGIPYLDIHGLYKDEKGMLPIDISDGNVHIMNRGKVGVFLKSIDLIP